MMVKCLCREGHKRIPIIPIAIGIGTGLERIRKHRANVAFVNFLDDGTMAQPSLLLCFLLRQDMTLVGALALDLTASGYLEALLGA